MDAFLEEQAQAGGEASGGVAGAVIEFFNQPLPPPGSMQRAIIAANVESSARERFVSSLNFYNADLGAEGAAWLAATLTGLPQIRIGMMQLSGNAITDDGLLELLVVFRSSSVSIRELYLGENFITDAGAYALAATLRANDSIEYVYLFHNPHVSEDGMLAVEEAVAQTAAEALRAGIATTDDDARRKRFATEALGEAGPDKQQQHNRFLEIRREEQDENAADYALAQPELATSQVGDQVTNEELLPAQASSQAFAWQ
jgi:Leucine Rich repeat